MWNSFRTDSHQATVAGITSYVAATKDFARRSYLLFE